MHALSVCGYVSRGNVCIVAMFMFGDIEILSTFNTLMYHSISGFSLSWTILESVLKHRKNVKVTFFIIR
jgi:hypothetical protein